MDIRQFNASDFPGLDEARFEEWKALRIKADRDVNIAAIVGCIAGILSPLAGPGWIAVAMFVGFVAAEIGFYRFTHKRLRQLAQELRMSDRLKALERGK